MTASWKSPPVMGPFVGVFGSVARGGAILPGHVRESVLKVPGHVGEGSAKEAIFGRGMFRKQS
ncbi:MAG: hypothetical protein EBT00_08690 [Proteobacteria bacterium]|nr:hypothetical protein [Pseudomonadota bacterium]